MSSYEDPRRFPLYSVLFDRPPSPPSPLAIARSDSFLIPFGVNFGLVDITILPDLMLSDRVLACFAILLSVSLVFPLFHRMFTLFHDGKSNPSILLGFFVKIEDNR